MRRAHLVDVDPSHRGRVVDRAVQGGVEEDAAVEHYGNDGGVAYVADGYGKIKKVQTLLPQSSVLSVL